MTAAETSTAQSLVDLVQRYRDSGGKRTHERPEYAALVDALRARLAYADENLDKRVRDLPEGCLYAVARDVVARSRNRDHVADVEHISDGFRIYTRRGAFLDVVHDQSRINITVYPSGGAPVTSWSGYRADAVERLNDWIAREV